MNIAIVGGRDFFDYDLLKETLLSAPGLDFIYTKLDSADTNNVKYNIVSGGAKGADSLAEEFAKEFGLDMIVFHADWKQYGRGAGMMRNKQIISESDIVFAFWDGKSKGTKNSIDHAIKQNKPLTIVYYGKEQRLC